MGGSNEEKKRASTFEQLDLLGFAEVSFRLHMLYSFLEAGFFEIKSFRIVRDRGYSPFRVVGYDVEESTRRLLVCIEFEIYLRILSRQNESKVDLGAVEDESHIKQVQQGTRVTRSQSSTPQVVLRQWYRSIAAIPLSSPTLACFRFVHIVFASLLLFSRSVHRLFAVQTSMASKQPISGLPSTSDHSFYRYKDVHMDTAKGLTMGIPDIHMNTAKGMTIGEDIRMDTAKTTTATVRHSPLKGWEKELVDSSEVKRKSTVAQLCLFVALSTILISLFTLALLDFLDYYFQLLGYIASRKDRRANFDADTKSRNLSPIQYTKEFKSYCGRERVILRRRRTKLKVDQFHIIAQVGQGGYGEVFLARKQDTGQVCALKKMRKRTLCKMDEVRVFSSFLSSFDIE
jgi:hypothetical protein